MAIQSQEELNDLVYDMAGYILPKLLKDLKIKCGAIEFDCFFGYDHATFIDREGNTFEFEVDMRLAYNKKELIITIAHELVHVAQMLRGDVFDFSKPYHMQDHEIEAYNLEEELAEYYNEVCN